MIKINESLNAMKKWDKLLTKIKRFYSSEELSVENYSVMVSQIVKKLFQFKNQVLEFETVLIRREKNSTMN